MRKITAAAFISLDGIMQAPGGPQEDPTGGFNYGGWQAAYWGDDAGKDFVFDLFAPPYALLLGRKTYEIFAAYWPFIGDDNPIAKSFNSITKYVVSHGDKPLTWANSVALKSGADIARLKATDGPRLVTQGSSNLMQTLLAENLIDEFRLLTYPLVLGRGKKFFDRGTTPGSLTLKSTNVTPKGVILSVYEPAGPVKTGSFVSPTPSALEIARQEKMKREGDW